MYARQFCWPIFAGGLGLYALGLSLLLRMLEQEAQRCTTIGAQGLVVADTTLGPNEIELLAPIALTNSPEQLSVPTMVERSIQ